MSGRFVLINWLPCILLQDTEIRIFHRIWISFWPLRSFLDDTLSQQMKLNYERLHKCLKSRTSGKRMAKVVPWPFLLKPAATDLTNVSKLLYRCHLLNSVCCTPTRDPSNTLLLIDIVHIWDSRFMSVFSQRICPVTEEETGKPISHLQILQFTSYQCWSLQW